MITISLSLMELSGDHLLSFEFEELHVRDLSNLLRYREHSRGNQFSWWLRGKHPTNYSLAKSESMCDMY